MKVLLRVSEITRNNNYFLFFSKPEGILAPSRTNATYSKSFTRSNPADAHYWGRFLCDPWRIEGVGA